MHANQGTLRRTYQPGQTKQGTLRRTYQQRDLTQFRPGGGGAPGWSSLQWSFLQKQPRNPLSDPAARVSQNILNLLTQSSHPSVYFFYFSYVSVCSERECFSPNLHGFWDTFCATLQRPLGRLAGPSNGTG